VKVNDEDSIDKVDALKIVWHCYLKGKWIEILVPSMIGIWANLMVEKHYKWVFLQQGFITFLLKIIHC